MKVGAGGDSFAEDEGRRSWASVLQEASRKVAEEEKDPTQIPNTSIPHLPPSSSCPDSVPANRRCAPPPATRRSPPPGYALQRLLPGPLPASRAAPDHVWRHRGSHELGLEPPPLRPARRRRLNCAPPSKQASSLSLTSLLSLLRFLRCRLALLLPRHPGRRCTPASPGLSYGPGLPLFTHLPDGGKLQTLESFLVTGDLDFVIGTDEAKKTDDIAELNVAEDFDNRPSKKATPSARAPPASLDLRNPVLCPLLELCLAVLHLRVDVVYSSDLSSDCWIKEMNQIVKFFVRRN